MKDDLLRARFSEISREETISITRLSGAQTERAIGIKLKGSSNPLYSFKFANPGGLDAIAYTSILNAEARPATRAEALGQSIDVHGEAFFDLNPFLLVFDFVGGAFMAVSAAKLFAAFANEAGARDIPYSGTANFSLTPSFTKRTVNMYGTVDSPDIWYCPDIRNLTTEDVTSGLSRIREDSQNADRTSIVQAVRRRLHKARTSGEDSRMGSSEGRLSYTASLVTQGRHKFYALTMPSEILAECSFVLNRGEDRELGFQRYLSKERAEEIASYLDSGLGTIPTSVILSAQPESSFEYAYKNRVISFMKTEKAFMIIDGQHRVYGFKLAKGTMRVPVVIYSNLSKSEEAQLFIDINGKQKPVPPELLLDIKKLANTQGDTEKSIGTVFDLFDSEPGSSLLGLLSPHEKKTGYISRVTFNAAIKPLMELFGEAPPERIYSTLNPYYEAVKNVFSKISEEIEFTSPMTFRGMTLVFPEVNEKVRFRNEGETNLSAYYSYLQDVLNKQKTSPFKGRQKSYNGVVNAMKEAMKPKSLF